MCGPLSAYPGYSLGGIDLDGCRDPETGEIAQWAETLIDRLGSYAEASPIGGGVHILFAFRDDDADVLRKEELVGKCGKNFSRGDHCEIAPYFAGKFLTYTGNPVGLIAETTGCPEKIKPVSLDDLRWLFGEYGPEFKAGRANDNGHNGDQSGSGAGYRFACDHFRTGATDDEVREAFEADNDDAGEWWQRIDRRQRDRTLENAQNRISSERAKKKEALRDQFDDIEDQLPDDCDPHVWRMNQEYAVVKIPNGAAIARIEDDDFDLISQEALKLTMANKSVPFGEGKKKTLAKYWLEHPERRDFKKLVFDPSGRSKSPKS